MRASITLTASLSLLIAGLAAPADAHAAPEELVLLVHGMVTDSCPTLVKAGLGRLDGVEVLSASLEEKKAVLRYDPAKVTPARILEVLEKDVGFKAQAVQQVQLAIEGMVTPSCPTLVEAAVKRMKGVRSVKADLTSKKVVVAYVYGVTSPAEIVRVIADQAGFPSKIL